MKLIINNISENESFARTVVAAYMTRLDPTFEELADVKTAVSEAVTNSIVIYNKTVMGTFRDGICIYGCIYGSFESDFQSRRGHISRNG